MNPQDNHDQPIHQLTAHLFRENSGKMVAVLSRIYGLHQIDAILDVVQDTFEAALTGWRFAGIPDNPAGWLMTVAKNKAINAFKRAGKTQPLPPDFEITTPDTGTHLEISFSEKEIKDSQLKLLVVCCQPDFSTKNNILLTLHILCGFGVPEIANALLMQPEAVKKALTRCKQSLKKLGNILQQPVIFQSDDQISTLHTILYLTFNEGYKTTRSKTGINHDLCYEAIRLTQLLLHEKNPVSHETHALLALMFFNLSRFPARLNENGEWLTLEEQDRSSWNKTFMEEGLYYLDIATKTDQLSHYHLEAIISSLHCTAVSFKDTPWNKIVYLYQQLEILIPNAPYITLNRIIAESYIGDIDACIQAIQVLEKSAKMEHSFLFAATRGELFRRMGAFAAAATAYQLALTLAISPVDKKFLERKLLQCQVN
jgi:RNA polymerase sigma factor (sigma-70 family)